MIACLAGPLAQWAPLGGPITVRLIRKAGDDLLRLQARTSLSKTDVVNRAITLYEFIDAQQRAGQELLLRDKETGRTQLVRFDEPGSVPPLPGWGGARQLAATSSRTSYYKQA